MVEFHTATQPREGTPVRLMIVTGRFLQARDDQLAQLEIVGRVDGEIENGSIAFLGNDCTFSHGELRDGEFRVATRSDGSLEGIVGWAVDLIGPLLTATYDEVILFQMPEDLPFTIGAVDSGTDWLAVEGKVAWAPSGRAAGAVVLAHPLPLRTRPPSRTARPTHPRLSAATLMTCHLPQ